tara:strand:- start:186 stop:371 length:186 start_codon:yes stop_codon:yes gene_type:complete
MTRETKNAAAILRASDHSVKFNLSDTGETGTAEGYDSHIMNFDRATMTRAEFEADYPGVEY